MGLPFDRFLNTVYFFATQGADEKQKNSFDMKLNHPPAGLALSATTLDDTPWSAEKETAALGGLAAALRGGA